MEVLQRKLCETFSAFPIAKRIQIIRGNSISSAKVSPTDDARDVSSSASSHVLEGQIRPLNGVKHLALQTGEQELQTTQRKGQVTGEKQRRFCVLVYRDLKNMIGVVASLKIGLVSVCMTGLACPEGRLEL